MKHNLKINLLFLIFGLAIILYSCEKEEILENEQTEILQLQNKFSLENFDDIFVKNNLEIDWDEFNTIINSENKLEFYQFNTHFKVKNSIEDYFKYKLLASKNESDIWDFEIIKFSTSKENSDSFINYFSVNDFTGSIYHYNLKGENTLIKVYSKGEIIDEVSIKDFSDSINTLAKAPAVGGTHCTGCWILVKTNHYTDWYTNAQGNGTSLYYSHSSYNGSTNEWIYIPGNNNYTGMPYDPADDSYHNHYHQPGGGNTDNHDDEVIADDDHITNNLTGKALCIFNKMKSQDMVVNALSRFDGENTVSSITLQLADLADDTRAITDWPDSNNNIVITLNNDTSFKGVDFNPNLFVVNTIIHEVIHAEFLSQIIIAIGENQISNLTEQEAISYLENGEYNIIYEYYRDTKDWSHNYMADYYRDTFARITQEFDTGNAVPENEQPQQLYLDIAWLGLMNFPNQVPTIIAFDNLPNSEKNRILDVLNGLLENNANENCQ